MYIFLFLKKYIFKKHQKFSLVLLDITRYIHKDIFSTSEFPMTFLHLHFWATEIMKCYHSRFLSWSHTLSNLLSNKSTLSILQFMRKRNACNFTSPYTSLLALVYITHYPKMKKKSNYFPLTSYNIAFHPFVLFIFSHVATFLHKVLQFNCVDGCSYMSRVLSLTRSMKYADHSQALKNEVTDYLIC